VFNLDELLADRESDTEPVSITVGGEDHESDREAYADD